MADADDNTQEGKKGGGFTGVAAGTAGLYAGARGATFVVGGKPKPEKISEAEKAVTEARGKYDSKIKTDVETNTAHAPVYKAFKEAEGSLTTAQAAHNTAISNQWWDAVKTEEPAKMGKLRSAHLKSQLAAINSMPNSAEKTWAQEAVSGQIKALEEVIGDKTKDFTKLSAAEAHTAIETAVNKAWTDAHAKPQTAGLKEFLEKAYAKPEILDAMTKADKDFTKKITEAPTVKTSQASLDTAKKALEDKAKEWKPIEEKILKTEKAVLDKATKKSANLTALTELSTKKGPVAFLTKPFKVLQHGGTGARLAIVGGAVAVGAIAYKGVSAMRGGSHAERIEQEKSIGGAAPSLG